LAYIWHIFGIYLAYIWHIFGIYLAYIWLYNGKNPQCGARMGCSENEKAIRGLFSPERVFPTGFSPKADRAGGLLNGFRD
jgi:hypothetical protein